MVCFVWPVGSIYRLYAVIWWIHCNVVECLSPLQQPFVWGYGQDSMMNSEAFSWIHCHCFLSLLFVCCCCCCSCHCCCFIKMNIKSQCNVFADITFRCSFLFSPSIMMITMEHYYFICCFTILCACVYRYGVREWIGYWCCFSLVHSFTLRYISILHVIPVWIESSEMCHENVRGEREWLKKTE